MQVGVQLTFQSFGCDASVSDDQVYDEELGLALAAEALGFDSVWPVEHHFTDYSFCPDNVVLLANLAARTKRIGLGTGAVILPWNHPVRVAEKISMLDYLAGGRLLFGMGRGLARREYEGLGVDMNEARDRFDEAGRMILDALETGFIEGEGPYYPQVRRPIRPRPTRSFTDRLYSVAMSPDSVEAAVALGARMVTFMQKPAEDVAKQCAAFRDGYTRTHERDAPRPVVCQFVYCDRDPGKAKELGERYNTTYFHAVIGHYELAGSHFEHTRGYDSYRTTVRLIEERGLDKLRETYLGVQLYGTPDQMVRRTRELLEIMGPYDLVCAFRYGGIPADEAQASMRLFASDVLPALRAL